MLNSRMASIYKDIMVLECYFYLGYGYEILDTVSLLDSYRIYISYTGLCRSND